MGIEYYVACRRCKVIRKLDKFYNHRSILGREDAIKFAEEMVTGGDKGFRAALLVSFLSRHFNHDCFFFSEHYIEIEDDESLLGYKYEESDLW
ncbi:MAG: hypothetical protein PHC68_00545 [Syntrophorhabdaceae bacterium]|nr:hypothetical protein [Syntrophorhabdaceae bacterium]